MKRGEEGFTLIETIVATGLLAVAATGFLATVLLSLQVVNKAKVQDRLDAVAHNALVDLYAVSAYDDGATAALSEQTRAYTVTEAAGSGGGGASTYAVSVSVYPAGPEETDATVRVSDAFGNATSMLGILAQAAPAPGSAFTPTHVAPAARSL